jgi:hypothetical protein
LTPRSLSPDPGDGRIFGPVSEIFVEPRRIVE